MIARFGWWVAAVLSLLVALASTRYFALDPALYFPEQRTYAVAALVGGASGIGMATTAYGGIVSTLGVTGLGAGWFLTTLLGWRAARAQRMAEHRQWMAYSFALCFAAVMLRTYLPLSGALGIDFDAAYPVIAWACWVPNVLLVAWWRSRTGPPRSVSAG